VAEWFKAAVLKTAVGASLPWVRIPPHPPPTRGALLAGGGPELSPRELATKRFDTAVSTRPFSVIRPAFGGVPWPGLRPAAI
jgi:hypothetical protein